MKSDLFLYDSSGWWIRLSLFLAMSLFVFSYATYRLHKEAEPLLQKKCDLEEKKKTLITKVATLKEITETLRDPSADEYALIQKYGRIPEGMKKLLFQNRLITQESDGQ